MGRILERTGVTYVLTFEPPDLELDGSYHKLDVRLAKDVGKARVVHRPGYYAPRPFAAASAGEDRLRLTWHDEGYRRLPAAANAAKRSGTRILVGLSGSPH